MNLIFPSLLIAMIASIFALAISFGVSLGSRLASALFNRKSSSRRVPPHEH